MSDLSSTLTSDATPLKVGVAFMSILAALMAFTSLSTDIYLPAMPTMARELQGNAELTITGFLIGFTIAQLLWGPISDKVGRRIPLFIGMIIFVIGSAGCAMSSSIEQIVFWRIFQAFGACTGPMLARAMVRDLFSRTRSAQALSTLTIIMAIAPIVGPSLGGVIIKFSSWHSIFWLLTVIGTLMFVSLCWLPETLPIDRRAKTSIFTSFSNYYHLLKNKEYMRYTLCVTLFYVSAYAFIAGSPFVYIDYFHIDSQYYGMLFGVNIIGVMIVSFCNKSLVKRHSLDALLKVATFIAMVGAVTLAIAVYFEVGGMWIIVAMVLMFFSMNGIIAASSTAAALDEASHIAGSASAMIGALQYGSGIISSLLLTVFRDGTPWTMAWIMALFTTLCACTVLFKSQSVSL